MHQGVFNLFEEAFIEEEVATVDRQINLFRLGFGQISNHPRIKIENCRQWQESELFDTRFEGRRDLFQSRTVRTDRFFELIDQRAHLLPLAIVTNELVVQG